MTVERYLELSEEIDGIRDLEGPLIKVKQCVLHALKPVEQSNGAQSNSSSKSFGFLHPFTWFAT